MERKKIQIALLLIVPAAFLAVSGFRAFTPKKDEQSITVRFFREDVETHEKHVLKTWTVSNREAANRMIAEHDALTLRGASDAEIVAREDEIFARENVAAGVILKP